MLTISRKVFRFLVLLSWLLIAASATLWFVGTRTLPPELQSYWDRKIGEPLTVVHWVSVGLYLFMFALNVAAAIGLYKFRSWGRTLYLFCSVISFVPLPPYEPYIGTIFSMYTYYLAVALSGFLLALLYFSPLSQYFESRGDQQTSKGSDTSWQT